MFQYIHCIYYMYYILGLPRYHLNFSIWLQLIIFVPKPLIIYTHIDNKKSKIKKTSFTSMIVYSFVQLVCVFSVFLITSQKWFFIKNLCNGAQRQQLAATKSVVFHAIYLASFTICCYVKLFQFIDLASLYYFSKL